MNQVILFKEQNNKIKSCKYAEIKAKTHKTCVRKNNSSNRIIFLFINLWIEFLFFEIFFHKNIVIFFYLL